MVAVDDWRVLGVEKMIAIAELHLRALRSYGIGDGLCMHVFEFLFMTFIVTYKLCPFSLSNSNADFN